MPAGLNIKGKIWRLYNNTDDDQGGAVPSGTVVYDNIYSRMSALSPTLALLEQGLETPTIYHCLMGYPAYNVTGSFEVLPNDQYEVTWPPISSYYGKKFLIMGVQHQSMDDERRYLNVKMKRHDTAHPNNLQ